MKTTRTIQAVLTGLLFSLTSFAQQYAYFPNDFSDYAGFGTSHVKDTIEIIIPDNDKIVFIADSLDRFNDVKIDSLFQVVKQKMGGSFTNTSDENKIKSFTLDSISNPTVNRDLLRYISLNYSVLAGLIRNDLAPGLSFSLEASSFIKGGNIGGFLSADMYYLFSKNEEGKYKTGINTFVNVGLTFPDSPIGHRIGIGMGFGKQFEKPAFKLSWGYRFKGSHITICPELYIVDGFKNAFPGITLRF